MSNAFTQSTFEFNVTLHDRGWWSIVLEAIPEYILGDEETIKVFKEWVFMGDEELFESWDTHLSGEWGWAHHFEGIDILVFEGDECANVDAMAFLLQAFLKECTWDPPRVISYTAAYTTDRGAPGDYSGMGVTVSAKEIRWFVLSTLIEKAEEEMLKELCAP